MHGNEKNDNSLVIKKKEYCNFNREQRNQYICKLYGDNTPKVVGKVSSIIANFAFVEVVYIVFEREHLLCEPTFFSDVKKMSICIPLKNTKFGFDKESKIIFEIESIDDSHLDLQREKFINGKIGTVEIFDFSQYELDNDEFFYFIKDKNIGRKAFVKKEIMEFFNSKESEYKKKIAIMAEDEKAYIQKIVDVKDKYNDEMEKAKAEAEEEKKIIDNELADIKYKLGFYSNMCEQLYGEANIPEDNVQPKVLKDSFDEFARYMKEFLQKKSGLYYEQDILTSFYVGLQSSQILLLIGNPGCGKSSLARNFPKIFGFEDTVFISVQSNWDSKNNLLGYYNPIDKKYMPEVFLSRLVRLIYKAKKYPEKLFFICLDEMNLAHIEHYFAEFLSIMQDDRVLNLYSEDIYNSIKREIEQFDNNKFEIKTVEEMKYSISIEEKRMMLLKYPYKIKIPENIKFIGTLNQDETTIDLSPKILDRSYVIKVSSNPETTNIDLDDSFRCLEYIAFNKFLEGKNLVNLTSQERDTVKDIVKMLSNRVNNMFMLDLDLTKWKTLIGFYKYVDYVFSTSILPKISVSDEAEYDEIKRKIYHILQELENDSCFISSTIFREMDDEDEQEIYYWKK